MGFRPRSLPRLFTSVFAAFRLFSTVVCTARVRNADRSRPGTTPSTNAISVLRGKSAGHRKAKEDEIATDTKEPGGMAIYTIQAPSDLTDVHRSGLEFFASVYAEEMTQALVQGLVDTFPTDRLIVKRKRT